MMGGLTMGGGRPVARMGGAPSRDFRAFEDAVMVGVHPVEAAGGALFCGFFVVIDILLGRDHPFVGGIYCV